MGVEITDLERAGESWRDGEERLRLATEAMQIGHWELDLLTGVAQRSLRHDQIFGYSELLPVWTYEILLTLRA